MSLPTFVHYRVVISVQRFRQRKPPDIKSYHIFSKHLVIGNINDLTQIQVYNSMKKKKGVEIQIKRNQKSRSTNINWRRNASI